MCERCPFPPLTYAEVNRILARNVADQIIKNNDQNKNIITFVNGGVFSAAFVIKFLPTKPKVIAVSNNEIHPKNFNFSEPFIILDDILDSGRTTQKIDYFLSNLNVNYYFLVNKTTKKRVFTPKNAFFGKTIETEKFITFPWEI